MRHGSVAVATACRLYEQGTVSLGKAAELAGLDVENLKCALDERGISRTAPESLDETAEMARTTSLFGPPKDEA